MRNPRLPLALAFTFALASPARADEGMWTFNNFPKDKVKAKYGFAPDDRWLDHLRLSSARLAGGCSGSFVSESGLVMTNHHCAHDCIQHLSTRDKDFVKDGFYARSEADEAKCPDMEIDQLVSITDVTARVNAATAGLSAERYNAAEKAELARIEKECQTSEALRCDVVSLYHGGVYNLYQYKRYQDVRLVFAPEFAIAFFGGDPDNFVFPRYDLDVTFVRVYEDGKPARMEHHLELASKPAKAGDLAFVAGHPGGTQRLLTVAELEHQRDVVIPEQLLEHAQRRGELTQFMLRSPEHHRIAEHDLFGVENDYKAMKGRWEAILDKKFFAARVAEEEALRARVARDPDKQKRYGGAWDAIAAALAALKDVRRPLWYMEKGGLGGESDLYFIARTLTRAADELPKPNDKRFRELRDSALPAVKQHLFSAAPIYDELEVLRLGFSLTKMREELGADHPFVRKVLGKESPTELAARLVAGTRLKSLAERKRLWDGGKQLIDASDDPFIRLARLIDADGRAIRKKYEDEIEGVLKKNDELIAKARFAEYGTSTYPDATFTLRLSYGTVAGWKESGRTVAPMTYMGGAFERATGKPPFDLPPSWLAARARITPSTPLNFCTTNDIIGGNSGSPVVDRDGRVIGLVFDTNLAALGGNFGYDEATNRTVSLHADGLLEALSKIYRADRIVEELRPPHGKPHAAR